MKFTEFPKMARLSREVIITEKIDGTNASIFIQHKSLEEGKDDNIIAQTEDYTMRVGSRTKWVTPQSDNYGFAKWVQANAQELFKLGEGHHFGEWWGQGIQRGYGLKEKRFSLFNVARWDGELRPSCCYVVPTLWKGIFSTERANRELEKLSMEGSIASPGFMKPEGIVVYHIAAGVGFKKTIEKDEIPKSLVKNENN